MSLDLVSKTIGFIIAERLQHLIAEDPIGALVKVSGFTQSEVAASLALLDTWKPSSSASPVELVVVAQSPCPDVPPKFLRTQDRSATNFRNDTETCVFFQIDEHSDAQSLAFLTRITDTDFSGAPLGVLFAAWKVVAAEGRDLPRTISEHVLEVSRALRKVDEISLRPWARFCSELCHSLAALQIALDEPTVLGTLGRTLPLLRMFPDENLAAAPASSRISRLQDNYNAAHRRDAKGKELDTDDLLLRLESMEWYDDNDEPLPEVEQTKIRRAFHRYFEAVHDEDTSTIDYSWWLQILARLPNRVGLGDRIAEVLAHTSPQASDRFSQLSLQQPLNQQVRDAAERFLEESEDPDLPSQLPQNLRRAVERLADRSVKTTDTPLRFLVRSIYDILDVDDAAGRELRLERRPPRDDKDDSRSVLLFSFLYGATLESIAASTHVPNVTLFVDPDLRTVGDPFVQRRQSDSDELPDAGWSEIRLQLRWADESRPQVQVDWCPRELVQLVTFARLFWCPDTRRWEDRTRTFDEWSLQSLNCEAPLAAAVEEPVQSKIVEAWNTDRIRFFHRVQSEGLSYSAIRDYVSSWTSLCKETYEHHVPRGALDPSLREFLRQEVYVGKDDSMVLLAVHPLRLRWLCEHLQKMERDLGGVLRRELKLNPVNEDFYFRNLEKLSPHEQPPLLSDGSSIRVAVREMYGHEELAVARDSSSDQQDWLGGLDDGAIEEIAGAIVQFVIAYPYKTDGLHLLTLVREGGARVLGRLLQRVLDKVPRGARMRITAYVFAPETEHQNIEDATASFDNPTERNSSDFPRVRVVLENWRQGQELPDLSGFPHQVDIAVVPNLFGTHTRCQEYTRQIDQWEDHFSPLRDASSYVDEAIRSDGSLSENVSRVLLPRRRDSLLERWSTVNVRDFRGNPVGENQHAVDYLTLNVQFAGSRTLFEALHELAHWVITLDAFVGRDQIEALDKPDVILVRPRVGKNDMYTLVVSSSAGKKFIVDRLASRLGHQMSGPVRDLATSIAHELYERARDLAPGILLRALGLGHTAREMVGLIVARHLVTEMYPCSEVDGFEGWLSLDQYAHWFGSASRSRADLLRVQGDWTSGNLNLRITVVESKFRADRSYRQAADQVKRTLEWINAALSSDHDDAEFWRAEILEAMEQSSKKSTPSSPRSAFWVKQHRAECRRMPKEMREAWLTGRLEISPSRGIICLISEAGRTSSRTTSPEGLELLHLAADDLPSVFTRMLGRDSLVTSVPVFEQSEGSPYGHSVVAALETASAPANLMPAEFHVPALGTIDDLERRYQELLDAFSDFNVGVRRPVDLAYRDTPAYFIFRVEPAPGVSVDSIRRRTADLKIRLRLPREFEIQSETSKGAVEFEVPKSDIERFIVRASDIWEVVDWEDGRLYAPIGVNAYGEVVGVDFSSSNSPHLLVAGMTGSGKSVALDTILYGLCLHHSTDALKLLLVDPKWTELAPFQRDPHLQVPIGHTAEDARVALTRGIEEMERRQSILFTNVGARDLPSYNAAVHQSDRLPWWLIVLDEFADLTSDRDDRKDIEGLLQRLAQMGRAAGIHLILATQKPSAEVISTTIRSNLPAQLALRVQRGIDSRVVMDETGAELLTGKGDAILKTGSGKTRIQCAMVSPGTALAR